jgi:hypothetical protein
MKNDDVLRDFSENDNDMNHWSIGGKKYILYRIVHVGRSMISTIRMASPSHPATAEPIHKIFRRSLVTKASQTKGIYEYRE